MTDFVCYAFKFSGKSFILTYCGENCAAAIGCEVLIGLLQGKMDILQWNLSPQ